MGGSKKNFNLWRLLPILAIMAGCGGGTTMPFDVTISASVNEGAAPLDVEFVAVAAGGRQPVTFSWSFGDGGSSIEQSPSYTYTGAGQFSATLTATDDGGDTATGNLDITVLAPLAVLVAADPEQGTAPMLVQFSSTITGGKEPYSYAWNFSDGGIADQPTTSHLFEVSGEFDVSLTVTDALGASRQGLVTVTVGDDHKPVASITAEPTVGVAPLDVAFQGNVVGGDAPFTYSWSFGDGGVDSTQNPAHTFASAGVYTVVLVVADADGDEDDETIKIQVATNEVPVVEITADPTDGIEPLMVQFVANVAGGNAPLTYSWDFDGDGIGDSILANPDYTFTTGDYPVGVTVTDGDGDEATDTLAIHVDPDTIPEVSATATPASGLTPLAVQFGCSATGVNLPNTYHWDFGDGQGSDLQNPSYTYTQAGRYTATCTVTDSDGDSASGIVQIDVISDLDPALTIQADPTAGLAPLAVQFASNVTGGNAPFTYAWTFGDGGNSDQANPAYTYTQVGTFQATLVVTDSDGDSANDSLSISVGDASVPAVTATANPDTGPAPLLVVFSCSATGGNPPYGFHWSFGDGTDTDTQNPTHTYTQIGDYLATCTVTDDFGQTGQGSAAVHAVNPNLPPAIDDLSTSNGWTGTTQTCAAVSQTMIQLAVSAHDGNTPPDVLSYNWTFDSVPAGSEAAFNNPDVMNPTFVPDRVGDYVARVRISDGNGGTVSQAVTVTAELAGRVVIMSPDPAPNGTAGDQYPEPLVVRLETDCGIPYENGLVSLNSVNGRVLGTSGGSDDQGLIQAAVELGCDITSPAVFTAYIPDDPDSASFNIGVDVGPAFMLLISPERDVPVHDATGAGIAMNVDLRVSDQCGNQVTGTETGFDIHTDNANGACFNDQCPSSPPGGTGVKDLIGQSTANGSANFKLYDTWAEQVDIWVDNLSGGIFLAGGFRIYRSYDFEGWDGGFMVGSTSGMHDDEWAWGTPTAGPGGANSGIGAWATVLDGDYNSAGGEDARYVAQAFDLPCTGGAPVYLKFWEYHDMAAGAVGYVSVNQPVWGSYPPAADGASAYDAEVNGHMGYQATAGGWRRVTFDLTDWQCNWVTLFWSLYLNDAAGTAFGWAIDDVSVEYFDRRAQGSFTAGYIWDGGVWTMNNGIAGCATSPGGFEIWGNDRWGNWLDNSEVSVTTGGAGTRAFTDAREGWIVSQAAGDAVINLGPWGWTDVWFTDSAAETVDVTLLTGSGSNPSDQVTFSSVTSDELGLCDDGMDNDCDGQIDCDDGDCTGDPECLPDLVADWHSSSFGAGNVRYEYWVCNYNAVDQTGSFEVAIYLKTNPSSQPAYPDDGNGLYSTRVHGSLAAYTCVNDTLTIGGLAPGDYDLWFAADWTDTVVEGDKTNNVIAWPATVSVPISTPESDNQGNCLDGSDNDFDSLQDCEDYNAPVGQTACRSNAGWTCDNDADMRVFGTSEPCNNQDDLGLGIVDPLSCSCVSDSGCDDIEPVFPFRCYTELNSIGLRPVCSIPCDLWSPADVFCQALSSGAFQHCDLNTGGCY